MRAWAAAAGAALLGGAAPALPAPPAPLQVRLEPVQVAGVGLDDVYTEVAGVESGAAVRLGLGASFAWKHGLELGCAMGRAALRTDFGLLGGPRARIERADAGAELRWRPPLAHRGWCVQFAAGIGRLALRYRPDHVEFSAGGETIAVDLDRVGAWTRSVAAELLHAAPGRSEIVLRAAWIFYPLPVATPAGDTERAARDLQAGIALRVPAW